MSKQPVYESVRPVSTDRAGNARRYMSRMAVAANSGHLGSEALFGLQRPSRGLPEGVPAMVLRRDSEGVWYAAEWSEPDAVSVPTPSPRGESVPTEASPRTETVPTEMSSAARTAERKRRHREAHREELAAKERARRARERGE